MVHSTCHEFHFKCAADLSALADDSVDLVVTSPPYPMIEMWDEGFFKLNPEIRQAIEGNQPHEAYHLMHKILDLTWRECFRVLRTGGIACINIGDATRTLSGNFQLYPNHARVIQAFLQLGFQNLPNIIWRKQTNAPNKFMGSGMYPPGAYVTLEHEYILVFRKGGKRLFNETEKTRRRASSYFWEERNQWFSDLWDLKGTGQTLTRNPVRERSGAFPFEIPYRLINMYSVQGDTVLDPFTGTGTTQLAAMASMRNSVGYELEKGFGEIIEGNILSLNLLNSLQEHLERRFQSHLNFVRSRIESKGEASFKYFNQNLKTPVLTRQETELDLRKVQSISKEGPGTYRAVNGDRPKDSQQTELTFSGGKSG